MSSRKLRVGIVGVGNCASSFVQGLSYYGEAKANEPVPGLMNVELGGYHVGDIEIASAFDINADKVGRDVAEAIFAPPEQHPALLRRAADRRHGPARPDPRRPRQVPARGDRGVGRAPRRTSPRSSTARAPTCSSPTCRSARSRRRSTMPSRRSRPAAPSSTAFRCSSPPTRTGARRFEERGLPIVGDDIKSQVGATIVHRVLANLFRERGVRLDRTYQLNFGGNTDFQNMLERERLESKKISKTQAVTSQLDMPLAAERRACRPERPRALADRPQVGLYPPGGHDLRRRAAERRAEARGLGFARTPPASSSTPCAAPSSRWTAASAAR